MTVVQNSDGTFDVIGLHHEVVAAGFATSAAAWGWIDRHDEGSLDDEERRRRIQTAFSTR